MIAELDHFVVAAASLDEGADHVERLLGVRPSGGGRHAGAGTHNRLLGLGPTAYLEVLAPDPDAPEPAMPRLFRLDDAAVRARLAAGPVLLTWVARTADLDGIMRGLGGEGPTAVRRMARGGLSWRLAEPPPGRGGSGIVPSLIAWDGEGAAGRLTDSGCRFDGMEGEHPDVEAVRAALAARGLAGVLTLGTGPRARWSVRIRRADGVGAVLASD